MIYFNENEPYAAEWLRNLYGDCVDDRSIEDVTPESYQEATRCHFFAGVGGWEYALQLAGWPADREVWTGSCPCQPLSSAGRQRGEKDERHLWPEFYSHISERRPSVIFGEQVASPIGREWLDGISLDLEELGYAVGSADLCAASVNAPHIRQRLYWVAYAGEERRRETGQHHAEQRSPESTCCKPADGIPYTQSGRLSGWDGVTRPNRSEASNCGWLGDSQAPRPQRHNRHESRSDQPGRITSKPWGPNHSASVDCLDGKTRRIPLPRSSVQPLAYGLSRDLGSGRTKSEKLAIHSARINRVGRLKGYGNAIVPQIAAEFIQAFMSEINLDSF